MMTAKQNKPSNQKTMTTLLFLCIALLVCPACAQSNETAKGRLTGRAKDIYEQKFSRRHPWTPGTISIPCLEMPVTSFEKPLKLLLPA
jgi:hypothetical protein